MSNKRTPFFSGWILWVGMPLCILFTVLTYNEVHVSDSPLPPSNWWWVASAYILVFVGRSYQYFKQKR